MVYEAEQQELLANLEEKLEVFLAIHVVSKRRGHLFCSRVLIPGKLCRRLALDFAEDVKIGVTPIEGGVPAEYDMNAQFDEQGLGPFATIHVSLCTDPVGAPMASVRVGRDGDSRKASVTMDLRGDSVLLEVSYGDWYALRVAVVVVEEEEP